MAIRNEPVVIKQSVLFLMSAGLIAGSLASARSETPSNYDKSGVPSALQSTTPDNSPVVVLPAAKAPETGGAEASETTGHAAKVPLDQGNGNWDPPPVTAPTTQH